MVKHVNGIVVWAFHLAGMAGPAAALAISPVLGAFLPDPGVRRRCSPTLLSGIMAGTLSGWVFWLFCSLGMLLGMAMRKRLPNG